MSSADESWWAEDGLLQFGKRVAANQAQRWPAVYRLSWRLRGRGGDVWDAPDNESKNTAAYCRQVFAALADVCPPAGRVLEIGPGSSLGVASLFAQRGHDTFALDKFPWRQEDELLDLYRDLGTSGTLPQRRIGPAESMEFPDGHFAFVYSNAVLEHVRHPQRVIRELARIVEPGGVTAHHVDVRDHRNFDRPLEFLRIPAWAWDAMYGHRSSYQNRWRASQFVAAFEPAFASVEVRPTMTLPPDALGDPSRFQAAWAGLSPADLAIVGFLIVARSPRR